LRTADPEPAILWPWQKASAKPSSKPTTYNKGWFTRKPSGAPTPAAYTFVETRIYQGSGCRGGLASAINGTTMNTCHNLRLSPCGQQWTVDGSNTGNKYSTGSKCLTTTNPFETYGSGVFSYTTTDQSQCGSIYTSDTWQFTIIGVCNLRTTGKSSSYKVFSCDPKKGYYTEYYGSRDCSGQPLSYTTVPLIKECVPGTLGKYSDLSLSVFF